MKKKMTAILAVLLFLFCLVLTLYPVISDAVNARYRSKIYTQYQQDIQGTDAKELEEALEAARAYNAALNSIQFTQEAITEAKADYEDLLNPTGNGIMGYLSIPAIEVNLPICHGTETAALESGVGHLVGTSLPVGGESTHCVLSGHTGMASQRLLTDLDRLTVGDVFFLKVLGKALAYEVDSISIVLPYDTSLLGITQGEDYCTLVTCTPYGVNSHRLLVRGKRTTFSESSETTPISPKPEEKPESTWKIQYIRSIRIGFIAAAGIGFSLLLALQINKRRKRHG